ncbi:Uncharacterised protein [Mycobacteroides abscessus subsp. massiliense]|uniref:Secreted protein n=2 Tax=Mycobacteriaceae TaxID=1762 RepID=A0A7V8LKZ4_9MYCO|nr:hypothetical protein AN909_22640 [Mycobacteroides immunogenum]CPV42523.1 Uncharacterised protein [Mycobacteroides abscessus]SIM19215.1 Uncharacterised protein [Mycobacteroides abscessus subsp. abscessus]SLD15078.1 Uncharacterised protein [Mycobacteroides abscessus subsp. massiliense]KPG05295.1 hypothetical protein AN908_22940 [Mycobacteroides immunogenum]
MGINRFRRLIPIVIAGMTIVAGLSAPPATAYRSGPCSDNGLIDHSQEPGTSMADPPYVCAGDHWELAPMPDIRVRQTLGSQCSVMAGTTAVATDPRSGSAYFSMCFNGAWTRYRP